MFLGTKAGTTKWEHPWQQPERCCSDCSILPPRNLHSHSSPSPQSSPIYMSARRICTMHQEETHQEIISSFNPCLKCRDAVKPPWLWKSYSLCLFMMRTNQYKSVMNLNHRTACSCLCPGEWDLMLFVCWLLLWFPWIGLTGCMSGPGPHCVVPGQPGQAEVKFAERE